MTLLAGQKTGDPEGLNSDRLEQRQRELAGLVDPVPAEAEPCTFAERGEVESDADGRVEHVLHVSVPPCGPDR